MNSLHIKNIHIHNVAVTCERCKSLYDIEYNSKDESIETECPSCGHINRFKTSQLETKKDHPVLVVLSIACLVLIGMIVFAADIVYAIFITIVAASFVCVTEWLCKPNKKKEDKKDGK